MGERGWTEEISYPSKIVLMEKGWSRDDFKSGFTSTIDSLKGIARLDIAIADIDGKILATTFIEDKDLSDMVVSFSASQADSQAAGGYQFFKIFDEHQLEFVLIAHGDTDDVYMVGKLAVLQIQTLLVAYREKFDKDNFIKNLLLDNLLLVDIYNRAKKLHIEVGVRRVVFLVESHETVEGTVQEALKEFSLRKQGTLSLPWTRKTVS